MQTLKRLIETYLGVPAAEPGEGTAWHLRYQSPWPGWVPNWVALLALIALFAAVVWIYRRDAGRVSRRMRWTLMTLRVAAILLLLGLLAQVSLAVDRTGLPVLVVMVDDSASMGLEDDYSDPATAARVKSLLSDESPGPATRLNLAKSILTRRNGEFLKALQKGHKLRVYRFSESAALVGHGEFLSSAGIDEVISALRSLKPVGEETRPGPSLQQVLDDLRGTPPTAVVLFTDGIASTSEADKLSEAAQSARLSTVPVYSIGIGSDQPARDVDLYDLLVDEVAFVGEPLVFAAKLKAYGFPGESVTVALRDKSSSEVLASTTVQLTEEGVPVPFELAYAPPEPGEYDLTLEASLLPGETSEHNNMETRHVSVRRDRIRVLLADNLPRWEFRALKQLLERETTVELHTFLQDADIEHADQDRTGLKHFPIRREQLLEYDVVIFGDLSPAELSSGVVEHLRHFVGESAGGVIFITGETHNPWSYRDTPLEELLPFRMTADVAALTAPPDSDGFRAELTLDGRRGTRIFWFAGSDPHDVEAWNSLEPLEWIVSTPELKPGARVFMRHQSSQANAAGLPIIIMQPYGGGRVLYHTTDELWRWRFRVGDFYYGRYWVQAIRYLSRSKLRGRGRAAELAADRLVYRRGDRVTLRLRFLDERLSPEEDDGVTVMIERRGDPPQPVTLSRAAGSPHVFDGQLNGAAEGSYHAWVLTPAFKDAPPSTDFRVETSFRELEQRNLDRADLVKSAELTHGAYYSLAEAQQLADAVPRGRPVPLETQEPILLWSRWELLLAFAALLVAEWLLRKRCRLI